MASAGGARPVTGVGRAARSAPDDTDGDATDATVPAPPLARTARTWFALGLLSFGGPAAQTALMHRTLVVERRWVDERRFLGALGFCMLLPGPEAMQLATWAGWRLHGIAGGLLAGLGFVLPGALVMLALGALYGVAADLAPVEALFTGVKAAVLAIVVQALARLWRRALARADHRALALGAFVALFLLDAPYPLVVVLAAGYGALAPGDAASGTVSDAAGVSARAAPSWRATLATLAIGLAIWWAPIGALALATDPADPARILVELGTFFSTLAVLTFGGAYAVLAWLAQDAVETHGWLTAGQMMDGLGLAETTPGPLILVTEFVGFLAGYREGGLALGLAGAAVTLWATFVPCFLWIFAGAPHLDWITAQPRLRAALAAVSAAVVGVILNLSLWFGLHVVFAKVTRNEAGPLTLWIPHPASFDWRVALLVGESAILLLRLRLDMTLVLAAGALLGLGLAAIA